MKILYLVLFMQFYHDNLQSKKHENAGEREFFSF